MSFIDWWLSRPVSLAPVDEQKVRPEMIYTKTSNDEVWSSCTSQNSLLFAGTCQTSTEGVVSQGGVVVVGRKRFFEKEGRAKHIVWWEELLSYTGGSVSQRLYILRGWFRSVEASGTWESFCWGLYNRRHWNYRKGSPEELKPDTRKIKVDKRQEGMK